MTAPTVSIAIPLYRSYRFLDIIIQNISNLPTEGTEILISDRHCDDDALAILEKRFDEDKRIRVLRATDRIDWVDHYNFLLREATAKYFMWMPHDDTFPAGYVTDLVQNLEDNPDAWLSFGDIITIDLTTQRHQRMYLPRRFSIRLNPHRPVLAVYLMCFWNIGIPFRGIFNRHRILERELFLKKTTNRPDFADIYWTFGLCLQGRLLYNNTQYCIKRYYPESTHAPWLLKDFFIFSKKARSVLASYVDDAHLTTFTSWKVKRTIEFIAFVKRVYAFFLGESVRRFIRQYTTGHQYRITKPPRLPS
ncbi:MULTISPECIES: glycosyltransferase [unclassified Spirosoma]|uniref:glycosyltransferase family 2 protein n=1 Tax=unclassified Spirosoma TaxID=2621999 RepID=UPI0009614DD2|nr:MULTISPECIES: glycosyltransferase [unclassified Spirosoma]MBN8823060.1 glycosyltransferase family 2 protein [Spirosoma sp.]OJW73158.1 MAG: hypothetical protein BGO59_06610 [Spirosoma sp. 48-14]